jgi:hypothetical protein
MPLAVHPASRSVRNAYSVEGRWANIYFVHRIRQAVMTHQTLAARTAPFAQVCKRAA